MTHEDRVWHHEMETLEGIHEHAERIANLEELALALRAFMRTSCSECDKWVQLSRGVGTCRLNACVKLRELDERMRVLGLDPEGEQ